MPQNSNAAATLDAFMMAAFARRHKLSNQKFVVFFGAKSLQICLSFAGVVQPAAAVSASH